MIPTIRSLRLAGNGFSREKGNRASFVLTNVKDRGQGDSLSLQTFLVPSSMPWYQALFSVLWGKWMYNFQFLSVWRKEGLCDPTFLSLPVGCA